MKCVGGNFYGTELLASGVSLEPQGSKDIAEIGYVAPSQCPLQSSLGEFTTAHTLVTGGNAWDMSLRTQRETFAFISKYQHSLALLKLAIQLGNRKIKPQLRLTCGQACHCASIGSHGNLSQRPREGLARV